MPEPHRAAGRLATLAAVIAVCAMFAEGQSVAILPVEFTDDGLGFIEKLIGPLGGELKIRDRSMTSAAFTAVTNESIHNMSVSDAKKTGTVLGCDVFLFARSETLRRASLQSDHFEAYAAVFAVSSRTGRLVFWKLYSAVSGTKAAAENELARQALTAAPEIATALGRIVKTEANEAPPTRIDLVLDGDSAIPADIRPPVPYRRIKPEYTRMAYLYNVTAAVEIEVDLDAAGQITRTEIKRWAGYGLDESAERAVREMQWRPAERAGKPLPARFVLRYNFRKIQNEQPGQ